MSERRKPDDETMELRRELRDCSSSMTLEIKELSGQISKLANAIEEWRKDGLVAMLKDYNDRMAFQQKSEAYGRRIIGVSKIIAAVSMIGGSIVAAIYFIANGHWPAGKP